MNYATLMVHLDAGASNSVVLDAAAIVAKRQGAKVIGVAACQPMQIASSAGDATGATIALEYDIANANLDQAEQEFHAFAALQPYVQEWRSINTGTSRWTIRCKPACRESGLSGTATAAALSPTPRITTSRLSPGICSTGKRAA